MAIGFELRRICVALVMVAIAAIWPVPVAPASAQAPQPSSPNVLLLNSYHPQYDWTAALVRGVQEELADIVPPENLHIEYMDLRRMVDDEEYLELLAATYARKYARYPFDVIISSDDGALAFLRQYRDSIFPGVPVVFCGVNSSTVEDLDPVPNFTGILEGLDVEGNLDLITRLHPSARRIVLIADRTSLGRGMTQTAKRVIPRFAQSGREIEIWDDFTLDELDKRMRSVGSDTVFLLLAIHKDREGTYFSFEKDLKPLTEHSRAPVYAMFGMLLGTTGVVGGMMNDPYEHGQAAAAVALKVLSGTPADTIPIVPTAVYAPRFDWVQLRRFDIPTRRLPPGSVVINRPVSFYEEHVALVWGVIAVIVALLAAIVWLLRLIRRMKRAERELATKQDELRRVQQLEVMGRLAGGVAHDFNNLITVISGFALLASRCARSDEELLLDHLGQIERATDRAAGLTRQLLAFARRQPVQPRVVDVNELLTELHKLLRRVVTESVELVVLPASEPALVLIDPGQLEQVLTNLAINARDAMPDGGRLTLRVEVHGDNTVIFVTDTGVGMNDDVKARIFEPFYTTKDVGKGTGLGLATTVAIVEEAKGTIGVESELGAGTSFVLQFPLASGEAAGAPRRSAPPSPIAEGLILLVEDDSQVRRVVRDALGGHGFTILEADNGAVALELVRRHRGRIRCVLTDVVMPILGGAELVKRLRAEAEMTPIVVMSGYVDDPSLLGAAAYLDIRFIAKPFALDDLVAMVSDAVARGRRAQTGGGVESPRELPGVAAIRTKSKPPSSR